MRAIITVVFSFLAATANVNANITTSYFLPNASYGTNRLRFVASVINASDDLVTLSVKLDNDPDYTDNFAIDQGTWTMGPTLLDFSTSALINHSPSITEGGYAYSLRCDIPATSSSALCTVSRGPDLVKPSCRLANRTPIPEAARSELELTQLYSFSDTDSVGVETIVRTFPAYSSRPNAEWCGTGTDIADISVPSSALVETNQLPSATRCGAANTGSPAATETGAAGNETGSPAAAPMKTVKPVLAGLGAAVAIFL